MLLYRAMILAASSILAAAQALESNLTVALVRSPPENWPLPVYNYSWAGVAPNLNATIDQGVRYMTQAKEAGANWIMFPELWFPGFPKGSDYNNWTNTHLPAYVQQALVKGSPEWDRLIKGIKDTGIYAALSYAEKRGNNLFMALSLISPLGDELVYRHKLRPSGGERLIFSDGTVDQIRVITSAYGRVGMLECGEHWYPSMTFAMQAQAENFHIGPFPYLGDFGDDRYLWWESAQANSGTVGHYSNLAGAYSFVPAVGYAFVMDPLAQIVAQISANASFVDKPMLYHSLNTSSFNVSKTYDADAQVSWGVLRQLSDGFPDYIPKIEGDLVPRRSVSIQYLLEGHLNSSTVFFNGGSKNTK